MRYFVVALSILTITIFGTACDTVRDGVPALSEHAPNQTLIVNGSRDPINTTLTAGQIKAVGYLADPWGSEFCTGTLINGTTVITAQHCTVGESASTIRFGVGTYPSNPDGFFEVIALYEHPSVDFAVLILAEDATIAVPGLTPIPMNREAITSNWHGRWLDASGCGDTYTNATGQFFASVELYGHDDESVWVDGHGIMGICYGDSGGPVLWQPSGGQVVVVGTEQYGDDTCVDQDVLTRVDAMAGYVDDILAGDIDLGPCDGLTWFGECDGDTARWCKDGNTIEERDCTTNGTHCGYISSSQGYFCLPAACGDVDYFGECDGANVLYCDDDSETLATMNCASAGQTCTWANDVIGYECGSCYECGGECVDVQSSEIHCGACNTPCAPAHATGACINATCTVASCASGYENRDANPINGCEAYVGTDDGGDNDDPTASTDSDGGCDCTAAPTAWFAWLFIPALLSRFRRRRTLRSSYPKLPL